MNRIKAAIYCRVSPFSNKETLISLCNRQKNTLIEKAVASNFDVTDCYQDIGYSGSDMKRPALQRMLQDYKDGKFSIVLVYNRDRLIKGNPTDIPSWPFPVLSATPNSNFERESKRIAQYMRAGKGKEKTLAQQRKAAICSVKKFGYR